MNKHREDEEVQELFDKVVPSELKKIFEERKHNLRNYHKIYLKGYQKEYCRRPEVQAKMKEYRQRPEVQAKMKEYRRLRYLEKKRETK